MSGLGMSSQSSPLSLRASGPPDVARSYLLFRGHCSLAISARLRPVALSTARGLRWRRHTVSYHSRWTALIFVDLISENITLLPDVSKQRYHYLFCQRFPFRCVVSLSTWLVAFSIGWLWHRVVEHVIYL